MSLTLLADLTLRGSLVFLLVALADRVLAPRMSTRWRRAWWLLVPAAFLIPIFFAATRPSPEAVTETLSSLASSPKPTPVSWTENLAVHVPASPLTQTLGWWIGIVWLCGVIISAAQIAVQTWQVHRDWSQRRFSTDAALLGALEDAKATAGITAPIGLIVSERIAAPALLGWLRPRILLPEFLTQAPASEIRAVLLHELAHFKNLDIPLNWLFGAARVVHWFNPLAWFATTGWAAFREEAADECAIRWLQIPSGDAYGEVLLKTLANCKGGAPYGALAIGESLNNLKRRIIMIRNHRSKSNHLAAALAVLLLAGILAIVSPTFADDAAASSDQDAGKKAAVAAADTWLGEMDSGDYGKTWSDASKDFQGAVSSDKWTAMSKQVRTPLGKLLSRKLASSLYQATVPAPDGKTLSGPFVVAQYETSFENLSAARETVTFQKGADGTWRAAGYYIKPR